MLTAELKVNGILVGVLYGHNIGYVTGTDSPVDMGDTCRYEIRYTEIATGITIKGTVDHRRSQGLAKLVMYALEALDQGSGLAGL